MDAARLSLYAVAVAGSLLVAGRLLAARRSSRLAVLLALTMVAWALNAALLAALLVNLLATGDPRPPWADALFLANAALLAAAPTALFLLFPEGGE